jgi:flagellar basal body rod protein FlgB
MGLHTSPRATIKELKEELADAVTSNHHIDANQAHKVHLILYELAELHNAKDRDGVMLEAEMTSMIRGEIFKVLMPVPDVL